MKNKVDWLGWSPSAVNVASALLNFGAYVVYGHAISAFWCVLSSLVAWLFRPSHLTPWDHLCMLGYSMRAYWVAYWDHHNLPGHDLQWFGGCTDLWVGHIGCIHCNECPDTTIEDGKHVGLAIWTTYWPWLGWIGQKACGLIGHPVFQHPKSGDEYLTKELYCDRCFQRSMLRKEWPADASDKS